MVENGCNLFGEEGSFSYSIFKGDIFLIREITGILCIVLNQQMYLNQLLLLFFKRGKGRERERDS